MIDTGLAKYSRTVCSHFVTLGISPRYSWAEVALCAKTEHLPQSEYWRGCPEIRKVPGPF